MELQERFINIIKMADNQGDVIETRLRLSLKQLADSNVKLYCTGSDRNLGKLTVGDKDDLIIIGPTSQDILAFSVDDAITHRHQSRYHLKSLDFLPGVDIRWVAKFYDSKDEEKGKKAPFDYVIYLTRESMPQDVKYEEIEWKAG